MEPRHFARVHCLFEQSGTFKREFIRLGIPAEDYDLQNNFAETDHIIDLFEEIEKAYEGGASIFDRITTDDLIMAFFPCIHFCDAKTITFRCVSTFQRGWSVPKLMENNIRASEVREIFFVRLMQLVHIVCSRGFKMVIENPWNDSSMTYLQCNFMQPQLIDKNRMRRGDYFVKPTAYWYFGFKPTLGFTWQKDKKQKIVMKCKNAPHSGLCSEERSMIHPDYARNFICDNILGITQEARGGQQLTMFNNQ